MLNKSGNRIITNRRMTTAAIMNRIAKAIRYRWWGLAIGRGLPSFPKSLLQTGTSRLLLIGTTFLWLAFVVVNLLFDSLLTSNMPGLNSRIVFDDFNRVELFFALFLLATLIASRKSLFQKCNRCYFVAISILTIQSAWFIWSCQHVGELGQDQNHVFSCPILYSIFMGLELMKTKVLFSFGSKLMNQLSFKTV